MSSKHLLLLVLSLVTLTTVALADYAKPPEHGKHKPHHHGAMPPAWAPHHGHMPHHKPHHHGAMPPAWAPHHRHMPHHRPGAPGPMSDRLLEKPGFEHKPFPGIHHHPPAHAPFPHPGHHPSHAPFPHHSHHHPPAHAPFPHPGHHPSHAPFPHHSHHHGVHPPMESSKGPHKPHMPRAPAPGHPY